MDTLTGKTFVMTNHDNMQFEVVSATEFNVTVRWLRPTSDVKEVGSFGRHFFDTSVRRGFFEEIS